MAARGNKASEVPKECDVSTLDRRIGAIARRQKGLIATRQLRGLGLGAPGIHYRLESGRLHCLDRGVYAVGHVPTDGAALEMAKLLAAGPGAALSHRAAAAHHSIRPSSSARTDITVPARRRARPAVRFHIATLPADELTMHNDFPITTVPRTLLDLAAVITEPQLELAIGEAEHLGLADPLSLPDLIGRYPRRRGTARIRRILDRLDGGGVQVRSELERRLFTLVAEHDLPRPRTNVSIEAAGRTYECDAVWPEARLIVELDGRTHHERRAAMQSDRLRDRHLAVAGWTVIRATWEQLTNHAESLLADLEALIYTAPPRRRSSVGRALHS